MRRWCIAVLALFGILGVLPIAAVSSAAADPPNPLPWERKYVDETWIDPYELMLEVAVICQQTESGWAPDSNVPGVPKIAVIGDSVQTQPWSASMADPLYRWRYATHCGESFRTAMDSGRLDHALAMGPDVIVAGMGSNNYGTLFQPDHEKFAQFPAVLDEFLQRTANVRCRVLFNIAEVANANDPPLRQYEWLELHKRANALYASLASRPGVTIIDWNAMVQSNPNLLYDDQHLTRAGINARINAAVRAARHCHAPDSPARVRAVAGNGMASVSWDQLPAEEGVTSYLVTSSLGHLVTTDQATVNVGGIPNGVPVRFSVTARNAAGDSAWSTPSSFVIASSAGARFHSLSPRRALDTRDGTGGKAGPFWPGESFTLGLAGRLPPEAANASAVVLNVTATGQTADTFVTVWPGDDSRPLTSNLNPRPGIAAVPAMATTRLGPSQSVQLYNSAGLTHLVVDVIGWYDAPGSGSGSLYVPVAPTRVLDSRDGTGGKTGPFGAADSYTLALPALPANASAVAVNVTATNTQRPGFVTIHPAGEARPLASNLNPQPTVTRANLTIAKLGTNRSITVFNNSATTDLIVDLVGYYGAPGLNDGGSEYFPMTPERHFDTRFGVGGLVGPISNGAPRTLAFAGRGALPATAAAVVAVDSNVTVVAPTANGHTSVWPQGPIRTTSILNFNGNEVVANRDLVELAGGTAQIWSTPSSIHYVVDVSGWFGPKIGTAPAAADVAAPTPTTTTPTSTTSTTIGHAPSSTVASRPNVSPSSIPSPRPESTRPRPRR